MLPQLVQSARGKKLPRVVPEPAEEESPPQVDSTAPPKVTSPNEERPTLIEPPGGADVAADASESDAPSVDVTDAQVPGDDESPDPATVPSSTDRVEDRVAETGDVLIVRPNGQAPGELNVVSSLEVALQRAADSPEVTVIELEFDELEEPPLTFRVPEGRAPLTIRAAAGYDPLIVFRPSAYHLASERRMINLIGGTTHFAEIHFRMVLPYDMAEGWALFHLNHVNGIHLSQCTLTISNPYYSPSTFFSIHGPRPAELNGTADAASVTKTPKIMLNACVARGQATFVQADEGLPFWLHWDQGFLATTDFLVKAAGLSGSAVDQVMRIHLSNVTAMTASGMLRLEMRESVPAMPELGIDCQRCVFVHDSHTPLMEYYDVDDVDRAVELLELKGEDNFYDFTEIRWRIVPYRGDVREYRWEDQSEPWYKEKRAERGLRWKNPIPTGKDVSQISPSEFELESSESTVAGFDGAELPVPPEPEEVDAES
jgi:hypothetical protein